MINEFPFHYEYANKKYEFLFVLEHHETPVEKEFQEYYKYPYISCKLYRKDMEKYCRKWQGTLYPDKNQRFELIYHDEINMRGVIWLFHSFETGRNFIFMDAIFGIVDNEEHFEGNILEITGQ